MNSRDLSFLPGVCVSADPADLCRIFDPDIQLAVWRRVPDPAIDPWLDGNADKLGGGFRQVLTPGHSPEMDSLPAGAGRTALADDICLLSGMLSELLGADSVGVRLEVLHSPMCPRFHIDRVGIRLLCTYRGPGTEWLPVGQAIPQCGPGETAPNSAPQCIDRHAVALLKGSLWQGNGGRGIVHRSPAVAHPPRILVAMDAGWLNPERQSCNAI